MRKKGFLTKMIVGTLLTIILLLVGSVYYLSRNLQSEIPLMGITLTKVEDGNYAGTFHHGRWTNEVIVHVEDHKIIDIDIVKDVVFSKPEVSELVIERVITDQDTLIDTVSEATITTKAYLKAIETALGAE